METRYRIEFEETTCGRCGGSGRYYQACFGCNGRGRKLSRAGSRAAAKLNELRAKDPRFTVRVGDLKPGDVVLGGDTVVGMSGVSFKRARRAVVTFAGFRENGSTYKRGDEWVPYFSVEFTERDGSTCSHGYCSPDDRRQLPLDGERWEVYLAYARTLKGCTVVEVKPKAAAEATA
jgi:hypothetical protein